MARTAVIAGTASSVSRAVNTRADGRAQDRAAADAFYAQQAAPQAQPGPAQPAPSAPSDDLMAQLSRLADMHSSGVLNDDEFAAAKAKLLA